MIPRPLLEQIEGAIPDGPGGGLPGNSGAEPPQESAEPLHIGAQSRVSGGSINEAARLETSGHGSCFLKWNRGADPDMFVKEVRGLELLRAAGSGLRLPRVLLQGAAGGTGYLLLEFVPQGSPEEDSAEMFGRRLAALHRNSREAFGLDHDNWIGRLPQSNTPHERWTDFFRDERLEPQLRMAMDSGQLSSSVAGAFERLYGRLDELLPKAPPSLLHGDLWGGNFFYDGRGEAVIYDPAVYYGHREIELAFTRLFGGFSGAFYRAYKETYPLEPGFDGRVDLYNLYPLLVHTNLFGGSYARQVEGIVRRF